MQEVLESKNHPKLSSEGLKMHSKSSSKTIVLQRMPSNLLFVDHLRIFNHSWIPNISKIEESISNSMLKNNTFLDSNFAWTFFVSASEIEGKIEQFAHFCRKYQFCKNHWLKFFPKGKSLFFWFGASKNLLKLDAQTRWKITSKKKPRKPKLGAIWPSQILEDEPPKRCKTKLDSRRYGNLADLAGN